MTTTPTQLGRYKILDEIGRGAMGVVYLAKDPLIGRLVALKTFRMGQALAGSELDLFRNRFIREAQSAGILSHPNIVTIHDVVEQSEEGATFIAMEYVRGTDLKGILASEGRLSLDEVVPVVTQVAEGLDYAHSKGVVHRDVKPANILITEERQVKLTDFGIARLDASSLTTEGQLLGTPNYMAPEQIQGQPTDHRADVFSLGVVLYEMLTGEKPFKGENVTVVTHRIVYDDYTAPEEHLGHQPPPVLEVLRRALAKDPDERFDSVREMAEALGSALAEIRGEERLNETQMIEPVPPAQPGGSDGTGARPPA
ncbi:MAG: serine/threonine-protein kinase, partial [Acidobacteriota bacterium]